MITFSCLGKMGQLGNQLFQYALLIGVSEKTGYPIKIVKTYKGLKKRNQVELAPFCINPTTIAHTAYVRNFRFWKEPDFKFHPEVFTQPAKTNFYGYFQSEMYFAHAKERVRSEFKFQEEWDNYAKDYIKRNRKEGSVVAVHVRRGDYLDQPNTFHVLNEGYYKKAMRSPSLPEKKQFFIFSDDLAWCKETLPAVIPEGCSYHFVETPDHWHDLAVMTKCEAHVIAASSFSWWGAWLANRKVVIAPDPWFPKTSEFKNEIIVPSRWEKVPV